MPLVEKDGVGVAQSLHCFCVVLCGSLFAFLSIALSVVRRLTASWSPLWFLLSFLVLNKYTHFMGFECVFNTHLFGSNLTTFIVHFTGNLQLNCPIYTFNYKHMLFRV